MKIVRTAASATLALTTALALAACTPPHENDSDQPFQDNQTGVSSPTVPGGASSEGSATSEAEGSETAAETATEEAATQGEQGMETQVEGETPAQETAGAATDTAAQ